MGRTGNPGRPALNLQDNMGDREVARRTENGDDPPVPLKEKQDVNNY